ncbi:MAG: GyrI-like domain-containing protein, partial [Armatimonadota bacterium]
IKFAVKGQDEALDFVVPPLEGLWWAEDMAAFDLRLPGERQDRSTWLWTLMIMMPEPVDQALYLEGHREACNKKCLLAAEEMRFEALEEGLSAQVMHIGPYAAEAPTIARLHEFISAQGHAPRGKHHEIYLSDPRKSAPERMRTVLRQPVG